MAMMRSSAVALALLLATVLTTAPLGHSSHRGGHGEEAVDEWFKILPHAKPKATKLHFFIHDVAAGPDPSIVPVARAKATAKSPTQFGVINVLDDRLTAGPKADSKQVGFVQGIYVSSSKEAVSLLAAINFVFTDGKHNGSTLSVLGRIAEFSENREFPILGGSGDFRLAQGIATANVYSAEPATGNRIVECRFRFLHY